MGVFTTEVRRQAVFNGFKNRCEAHEQNGTWPSKFAKAFCLSMLDVGIYPSELARRLGIDERQVWLWTSGKYCPQKKWAARLERALDIRPGDLVEFAGEQAEAARLKYKQMWDRRRKKAGTLEARKELTLRGDFTGGTPVLARFIGKCRRGSPLTISHRLRIALGRMCRQSDGKFIECRGCRKPLYRPNCRLNSNGANWHNSCHTLNQRSSPRGYLPPRKPGAEITTRIAMVLLSDGLDQTARQIYENSPQEDIDIGLGIKSVQNRIKSGRKDLEGLSWGDLAPQKNKPAWNINRVLKDFSVLEVLKIASSRHPLSIEVEIEPIKKWFPQPKGLDPLKGFCVADNPLAQCVAETIRQRFRTIKMGAKSVGLSFDTLKGVLTNRWSFYRCNTWIALSALTGRSQTELRRLKNAQVLAPTK